MNLFGALLLYYIIRRYSTSHIYIPTVTATKELTRTAPTSSLIIIIHNASATTVIMRRTLIINNNNNNNIKCDF